MQISLLRQIFYYDRSTNTIVKNYYVLKYVFIQIIVYGLWKDITTSFPCFYQHAYNNMETSTGTEF